MVSASLGSVSISPSNAALTLREAIEARLRRMPDGKGILFTIDEAQAASEEDLVALATAIQHVLRDEDMRDVSDAKKHGVAFVFAALPSMVDEVLNNKVLTFLRRSQQQVLAEVPLADVRAAYVDAVRESGKEIGQEDAFSAAQAAAGYPYMVQLVGYYMWQAADRRGSKTIERADVERGASDAVVAFGEAVCAPIMDGLTPAQREFVKAVAADAPSSTAVSDIAKRCSRSSSWVSKYRASLIKEHVIEADGKGYVRLSTPHMAEYLRGSSW
jgi:predicted transcriptional regulator